MPFELKEAVLVHAVDIDVMETYQRSDRIKKRKALIEKWTEFMCE